MFETSDLFHIILAVEKHLAVDHHLLSREVVWTHNMM